MMCKSCGRNESDHPTQLGKVVYPLCEKCSLKAAGTFPLPSSRSIRDVYKVLTGRSK